MIKELGNRTLVRVVQETCSRYARPQNRVMYKCEYENLFLGKHRANIIGRIKQVTIEYNSLYSMRVEFNEDDKFVDRIVYRTNNHFLSYNKQFLRIYQSDKELDLNSIFNKKELDSIKDIFGFECKVGDEVQIVLPDGYCYFGTLNKIRHDHSISLANCVNITNNKVYKMTRIFNSFEKRTLIKVSKYKSGIFQMRLNSYGN